MIPSPVGKKTFRKLHDVYDADARRSRLLATIGAVGALLEVALIHLTNSGKWTTAYLGALAGGMAVSAAQDFLDSRKAAKGHAFVDLYFSPDDPPPGPQVMGDA